MFLAIKTGIRKRGKSILLRCDECHKEYLRDYKHYVLTQKHHLCSKECLHRSSKPGGSRYDYLEKQKRAGVEKLGVKNVSQLARTKIKCIKTFQQRYGVTNPSQITGNKEKVINTSLKRYGVEWPSQSTYARSKQKKTLELRSVEHKLQIRKKIEATTLHNHGSTCILTLPHIREKCNSHDACQKRHETMKKNGSYKKSKIEDRLYEILNSSFANVQRQVRIKEQPKNWSIDFYISDIQTYVQLDGMYWHGLDRCIDEIKQFKTSRDKKIYEKWCTDKEQNAWFENNQLRLVRLTDLQIKTMTPDEILGCLTH